MPANWLISLLGILFSVVLLAIDHRVSAMEDKAKISDNFQRQVISDLSAIKEHLHIVNKGEFWR